MNEMEAFLLELHCSLNDLEDKVTRLHELLELMQEQAVIDSYEKIFEKKGITLPINPN